MAVTVQFVCFWIIQRNGVDVYLDAVCCFDVYERILYDGQGFKSQKVHLYQPRLFDDGAFVLRHKQLFLCFLVVSSAYRDNVGYIGLSDNNATGVYSGTANVPLEHLSIFERIPDQRVGVVGGFFEFRNVFNGFPKIYFFYVGNPVGNQFCQPVCFCQRQFMHAGHITDRRFCSHSPVGDDAGDLFESVLFSNPLEYFVAAFVVEINVYVRHGDTVRVEEPLEQQIVFQRIDIRDSQAVCHSRSGCRSTARTNRNVHLACRVNKVLDDQEIPGKSHVGNGIDFKLQP
ncbi:hypothetical protein SDC9_93085 [bioreactor metagenome]|uniref:Uncharacterized protein n=1 Tax=bioreactor metagenome TaxID=1076179 RepID=A0A644ZZI9_9ZZZZ